MQGAQIPLLKAHVQLLACCKAWLSRAVVRNKAALSPFLCRSSPSKRRMRCKAEHTGFNPADAMVPHCLVGLFPGKALLRPYLPVLPIVVRMQQLPQPFVFSIPPPEVCQELTVLCGRCSTDRDRRDSFHLGARFSITLSCCTSGLAFGALCPRETDLGISQRAFINYTAPKRSSPTSLLHDFPSKQTFPCLFRQFMVLCHNIMLITVTTEAASVLHKSVLDCCLQLWCSPGGHFQHPWNLTQALPSM